jgi:aldehyde dehydrogenase (NAD+)
VLEYSDLEDAILQVSGRPKPLSLYLFSNDRLVQRRIIKELSFGGGCINDTVVHYVNPNLPFGGVGESGMGCYHGRAGFESFSHRKSILKNSAKIDIRLRYPPYKGKLGLLRKLY